MLSSRTVGDDEIVLGRILRCDPATQCEPFSYTNINFVTHFSASKYDIFYSTHLEQLAIALPNLQQLNLLGNINCLKNLKGLRAIATCCRKLEDLNIMGISDEEIESCIQLWKILVNLQLTYLAIELCCLLCFEDDETKQSVFRNV